MPYAILRHQKLTSHGAIAAAFQHNARLKTEPNVDPSLTDENVVFDRAGQKVDPQHGWLNGQIRQRFKDAGIEKIRDKTVLAVELMMTTSPEWWDRHPRGSDEWRDQLRSWARANVKYVKERFGAENVMCSALHLDEATPHLHVIVTPIAMKVDRRTKAKQPKPTLCAKDYLGGAGRHGLSRIVQEYGERMRPFGLEPGQSADKREKAVKRTTLKEHQVIMQSLRVVQAETLVELGDKHKELVEREKASAAREHTLEIREGNVREREARSVSAEAALKNRAAELDKRDHLIQDRQAALEERERILSERERALKAKEQRQTVLLAARQIEFDAKLSSQEAEAKKIREAREQELAGRENALTAKEAALLKRERDLTGREQALQEAEAQQMAVKAGTRAWASGELVGARLDDEGQKHLLYRDVAARDRWQDQILAAFDDVWEYVREQGRRILKAIEPERLERVVQQAALQLVTPEMVERVLYKQVDERRAALEATNRAKSLKQLVKGPQTPAADDGLTPEQLSWAYRNQGRGR